MRLLDRIEKAFVASLVEETRLLARNSGLGVSQQVARLQTAVSRHAKSALKLREERKKTVDPTRRQKLDRIIAIRENAVTYLVATSKWLVHRDAFPHSLRQRPRIFAIPAWEIPASSEDEAEKLPRLRMITKGDVPRMRL